MPLFSNIHTANHKRFKKWLLGLIIAALFTSLLLLFFTNKNKEVHLEIPDAIGRLVSVNDKGEALSDAICTGVLISPNLILSAWHCISSNSQNVNYRFEAGYNMGMAHISVTGNKTIHLNNRVEGVLKLDNDLGLIHLNNPIPDSQITPLKINTAVIPSKTFFYGYKRTKPEEIPKIQECTYLRGEPEYDPRVIILDCDVESGNSGAPLLVQQNNQWMIVGILVARSQNLLSAFAVIPPRNILSYILHGKPDIAPSKKFKFILKR